MSVQVGRFKGIMPAMVTPLTKDKEIDFEATEELVDFLLDKGVNGLFVLGSCGEGLLFSVEERRRFVMKITGYVNKRVPVIVFSSHMELKKTKKLIKIAQDDGADAAAILPPFYYNVSDEAIEKYFRNILREFPDFSFFIYNIPQFTMNEVNLHILQNLAKSFPNFVGLKNSKHSLMDFQKLLPLEDRISLFMGTDSLVYPALAMGAKGAISGIANVFPEIFVRLYKEFTHGNYEGARRQQRIIHEVQGKFKEKLNLQEGAVFHFFKIALRLRGIDVGGMKEPLSTLDSSKDDLIFRLLKEVLGNEYV